MIRMVMREQYPVDMLGIDPRQLESLERIPATVDEIPLVCLTHRNHRGIAMRIGDRGTCA
jgi:hypothetical protein